MGQYYLAIILSETKLGKKELIRMWMSPHAYSNGAKLTEHSYIGNSFIQAFEYIISPDGMFYKSRIVWAGDYAEPEEDDTNNLYKMVVENGTYQRPKSIDTSCYRYIVNHSKNMYVDKERNKPEPEQDVLLWRNMRKNFILHPLPLLVSEGNGMGGGDYHGNNKELCGTWARDIISVEMNIPDNFTELVCDFV
jgi:hypothetical protein